MITKLDVHLQHFDQNLFCGQLVMSGKQVYFKYAKEYLEKGFNISPFKMMFNQEVQSAALEYFENLFGVFHDSLPDGWGQLLMLRYFHNQNIATKDRNVLLQLSCLSDTSKGGLLYKPTLIKGSVNISKTIDELYKDVVEFYSKDVKNNIDDIFTLGGSSGGARPKIDAWIERETQTIKFVEPKDDSSDLYLVKFRSDTDYTDISAVEYCYMLMASQASIEVPDFKLLEGKEGRNYFASKRFDRKGSKRIHTISVAGLLHDNFRNSNIDYGHIMDAAFKLDPHFNSYEKVLRLAVFNVLAHNKDDHSKNISFVADEACKFKLSAAYDLTFSYGINAYRSTAVAGEQRTPTIMHITNLANHFGVKHINDIVEEVYEAVKCWPKLAKKNKVSESTMEEVQKNLIETAKTFFIPNRK